MSTAVQVEQPTSAPPPPSTAAPRRSLTGRSGIWFTVPFFVFFAAFLVYPVLYGLYLAFTDATLAGGGGYVGFANFGEALTDPLVWQTLANTVFFTIGSTVPLVLLPLAMALLVHLGLPGQWLWRLAFFAPFLLPVTVVSLIWVWILQPELGLVNDYLAMVGIAPIPWLQQESTAMWGIIAATVWWTAGFNFLLYLAALQGIPAHIYEASAIDGAGPWRQLRSITLPLLNPTTVLVLVLQVLASLKVFDQIYQMTLSTGGPNGSTRSILMYVYDTGFSSYRLGYASAIANIFFLIIVVLSLAQLRLFNRKEA